jgi:hypothetical protein
MSSLFMFVQDRLHALGSFPLQVRAFAGTGVMSE